MADINSSLPVKTLTDGDVVVKLSDGTLTATVRNAGTNDALNVAVVDGAGNQVTAFGGGTEYIEDVASAGGEVLKLAGAIREDAPSTTTSNDGDFSPLKVDASGRLWVNASSAPVEISDVTPGTGATDLGKAEDAVHASGDVGVMALAVRKDTAAGLAADGDYHVLEVDASGRLHVNVGNTVAISLGESLSTTEVNNYDTTAALAAAGTDNHDYTVVTTMRLKQILASASGKMKVELFVGPVGTLVSKGVWFNSTANPNIDITFASPIEVPNTSTGTVRLARTNLEAVAQDVYSTILGNDI